MSKAYKGGDFERETCKRLSRWWTGDERDDVYWRSSQSGGRATFRRRTRGLDTYGHHGDIAAVDPIGEPLLKLFTIELKRGSSIGSAGDLIDTKDTTCCRPFESAIIQSIEAANAARSKGWMLICRRDHRIAMVYADAPTMLELNEKAAFLGRPNVVRFDVHVNTKGSGPMRVRFVALPLESFLTRVSPEQIKECVSAK